MNKNLRAGPDLDQQVHRSLHASPPPEEELVPAYSTDEPVILAALQTAFGPLDVAWTDQSGQRRPCYRFEVAREGRKMLWAEGETGALALCNVALMLAAHYRGENPVPPLTTGFYWFRPACGVYFPPSRHFPLFAFSTSEPIPVFVRGHGKEAMVIGVGYPLEWPEYPADGGAYEVPVGVLPGEFGPRIEPPREWQAKYDVARLLERYDPRGGRKE